MSNHDSKLRRKRRRVSSVRCSKPYPILIFYTSKIIFYFSNWHRRTRGPTTTTTTTLVPLEVIEDLRQQEVKQGPELGQVVLQRRAGQQELVVCGQQLQLPHQAAVEVLDPVALVHDQVLPLEPLAGGTGGQEGRVTGRRFFWLSFVVWWEVGGVSTCRAFLSIMAISKEVMTTGHMLWGPWGFLIPFSSWGLVA